MEEQLADREEHGGARICRAVAASKQFTVHLLRGDAKRKSAQNAIELLGQKCKIRKRAEHPIRVTWAQSGEAETSSQSEYEESSSVDESRGSEYTQSASQASDKDVSSSLGKQ